MGPYTSNTFYDLDRTFSNYSITTNTVCISVTVHFNIVAMENEKNNFRPTLAIVFVYNVYTHAMIMFTMILMETQTQMLTDNTA